MQNNDHKFFVEINRYNYIFVIGREQNDNFEIIYFETVPIIGIEENKIQDLNSILNTFKENIFKIEKKFNITLGSVTLILDNFDYSFTSFTGYKKLNGSQLVKENITYLLNFLKSKVVEIENHKKIIHIFNSKFILDRKKIDNLPIGLFGNFYSHELSFFMIKNSDHKNIINIFNKCNLKIIKILSKNFLDGVNIINRSSKLESFFKIEINEKISRVIFFENSALRFAEDFNFGYDTTIKDISKITGLDKQVVKKILIESDFSGKTLKDEYLEKNFFEGKNFRKISKELILDIGLARFHELIEIMILKNINLKSFTNEKLPLFLTISDKSILKCYGDKLKNFFSNKGFGSIDFINQTNKKNDYVNANKLVQFGWKKEAVPFVNEKKSILARLFQQIFK